MKKIVVFILGFVLVMGLAACGSKNTEEASELSATGAVISTELGSLPETGEPGQGDVPEDGSETAGGRAEQPETEEAEEGETTPDTLKGSEAAEGSGDDKEGGVSGGSAEQPENTLKSTQANESGKNSTAGNVSAASSGSEGKAGTSGTTGTKETTGTKGTSGTKGTAGNTNETGKSSAAGNGSSASSEPAEKLITIKPETTPDTGKESEPAEQPESGDAASSDDVSSQGAGTLVVYFSMPETTNPDNMTREEDNSVVVIDGEVLGNTQYVAYVIQENTGADIFRIEPETPYPTDHDTLVDLAAEEQAQDARPAMKGNIGNLEEYGTIFIGYPKLYPAI